MDTLGVANLLHNTLIHVNPQALQDYPDASWAICSAEHPPIPVARACRCRKVYCRGCIAPALDRGDPCPTCWNLFSAPGLRMELRRRGLDVAPMSTLLTLIGLLAGGLLAGCSGNGVPHLQLFVIESFLANLWNAHAKAPASNTVYHILTMVLVMFFSSNFMLMLKLVNRYPAIAPATGRLQSGRLRSCMAAMERLCCSIVIGLALFAHAGLVAYKADTSRQPPLAAFVCLFAALHVQTILRSVARRLAAQTFRQDPTEPYNRFIGPIDFRGTPWDPAPGGVVPRYDGLHRR